MVVLIRILHLHRWLFLLAVACLPACTIDVSHNPNFPTDYAVGAVYRLKRKVLVQKRDKTNKTILGIYRSIRITRSRPNDKSIEERERDPDFLKSYAGVARPGTVIQVTKILCEADAYGIDCRILGRVLDGPWATKQTYMDSISREVYGHGFVPKVDKNMLELVRKP